MPIVRTDVPMTSALCNETSLRIVGTYPFCRSELLTTTAFDRPIRTLVIGQGPRKVIYSAAHHANEWITTPVLLKFVEEFADPKRWGDLRRGCRGACPDGHHLHGAHGGSGRSGSGDGCHSPGAGAVRDGGGDRGEFSQHSLPRWLEGESFGCGSESELSGRMAAGPADQVCPGL